MEKKELSKKSDNTKKSRNPLLYVIFGVVVILLAVKVYLDYREKQELQEFYQTEMEAAKEKLDEWKNKPSTFLNDALEFRRGFYEGVLIDAMPLVSLPVSDQIAAEQSFSGQVLETVD